MMLHSVSILLAVNYITSNQGWRDLNNLDLNRDLNHPIKTKLTDLNHLHRLVCSEKMSMSVCVVCNGKTLSNEGFFFTFYEIDEIFI